MKKLAQILFIGAAALAMSPARAADATPEFSAGFCAGWQIAFTTEHTRFNNWRMSMVGSGGGTGALSVAANTIADTIPPQVLLPPLAGKFQMDDGRIVDCTPKAPEAAPAEKP